jgi:pyridinium-3,5-biscarboxylic acid mononucleotide sulfurtransferase
METAVRARYDRLLALLSGYGRVAVAFSGGVDSSLLLAAGREALGSGVSALFMDSVVVPGSERDDAAAIASELGVDLIALEVDFLAVDMVRENPEDRCYHCKLSLLRQAMSVAAERGLGVVAEGTNVDDSADYRPGRRALRELGILSPLEEAGLTKSDIRHILKEKGLAVWNKPSQACLASRIPYGSPLTVERLHRVRDAEAALSALGYSIVRVRDFGHLAVVEVGPEEVERLLGEAHRGAAAAALLAVGYSRVAFDSAGYRMGSLNAGI